MVIDVDSSGTASSIGVPGYESLQFSGSFWVSHMFASPVFLLQWYFLTICPLCVRCMGKSSPCVKMISFVLLDSQGLFKLPVSSDTVVWPTFSLPLWHPLLALIWSSLSPLMGWFFPKMSDWILGSKIGCSCVCRFLPCFWYHYSSFHLPSSILSTPTPNPCAPLPRISWGMGSKVDRGTALKHPWLFLSFHTQPVSLELWLLWLLCQGELVLPSSQAETSKETLVSCFFSEPNGTGQFSEVLILLPSQSHFHPAHI